MIHFSHTHKFDAWAQGKHAVVWLDGNTTITPKLKDAVQRELIAALKAKGAIILAYEWRELPGSDKPLCVHCDERVTLPYSSLCPFCHGWAKQHEGELPSPAVLAQRDANRQRNGWVHGGDGE